MSYLKQTITYNSQHMYSACKYQIYCIWPKKRLSNWAPLGWLNCHRSVWLKCISIKWLNRSWSFHHARWEDLSPSDFSNITRSDPGSFMSSYKITVISLFINYAERSAYQIQSYRVCHILDSTGCFLGSISEISQAYCKQWSMNFLSVINFSSEIKLMLSSS
jgi:hypothetical protein